VRAVGFEGMQSQRMLPDLALMGASYAGRPNHGRRWLRGASALASIVLIAMFCRASLFSYMGTDGSSLSLVRGNHTHRPRRALQPEGKASEAREATGAVSEGSTIATGGMQLRHLRGGHRAHKKAGSAAWPRVEEALEVSGPTGEVWRRGGENGEHWVDTHTA
jgi:hypothetical protein